MKEQWTVDYERFAAAAVKTVNATFETMDRDTLEKAANLILEAKTIITACIFPASASPPISPATLHP